APMDAPDAGDDAGCGRFIAIHAVGRQGGKLEEWTAVIEQSFYPVAHQQLAAFDVPLARIFWAAPAHPLDFGAQFAHLSFNDFTIAAEFVGGGVDARFDAFHRIPLDAC